MSLVGSLEDLGLGDILQIITLSRKSGALVLRSDDREGRVMFRDGLVCGARVKGSTPDLRQLLVDGDVVSESDFESLRAEASNAGTELSAALREKITPERFEGLSRECVEGAVLTMFGWASGEFSFEVGLEDPEDAFEVVLETGINAQYLAMEGTRRTDEGERAPEVDPDDPASFADLAEEMDEDASPSDAFEAVALTTVEQVESAEAAPVEASTDGGSDAGAPVAFNTTEEEVEEALEAAIAGELTGPPAPEEAVSPAPSPEPTPTVAGVPATGAPVTEAAAPPVAASLEPSQRPPIVVLAPELPVLEWVKRALEGAFRRVHIFQKTDLAVQRLRQYVVRGGSPIVLVSPELGVAGDAGVHNVDELVSRIKKQSPRSSVLWLGERGELGSADGCVPCASNADAANPAGPDSSVGDALQSGVLNALAGSPPVPAPQAAEVVDPRLAPVLARMDDPQTQGEVLNVALDFAAEHFGRVALLAVRDGQAMGVAGLGLDQAGGPDDEGLRELRASVDGSNWLTAVVDGGESIRSAPTGDGDGELADLLGAQRATEAWLSPVVSGEKVVAVLYGDNLPANTPLGQTDALETALARAGQVLGQVMAERVRTAD